MSKKKVKTIAFYLPQFHTIPENDEAYGKGFTEWVNTKKAKPLFDGHYQPRTPLNENYYCLLDEGVMEKQIKLAKENGVYGFCYYHYWFKNGKKLLEKPIEKMLQDPSLDMPFCLCWANENWSKRWDGGDNGIIVSQDYGDEEDLKRHVDYLCEFFKDSRYIKKDGKPILLIYKLDLIPNLEKTLSIIRKRVKKNGFPGVEIIGQYPKFYLEKNNLQLLDGYVQFQPRFIQEQLMADSHSGIVNAIKRIMIKLGLRMVGRKIRKIFVKSYRDDYEKKLEIRDYDADWNQILNYKVKDPTLYAGAFVDWDNTPRNVNGLVYTAASPEKFEKYMKLLLEKVKKEYKTEYIFINAWNEWAEGAYLEPDEKYGYAYLHALKRVMESQN